MRAAPSPFHHIINCFPAFSSSKTATLSIAGVSAKRTGRSALVGVITDGPSAVRFQRFKYSLNMIERHCARSRFAAAYDTCREKYPTKLLFLRRKAQVL